MENRKILIIGLDGATLDLILPWAREGKLPTLANLMDQGVWGNLRSTIHALTPQAWSSFMTGRNAGKHGVFDFTELKPGTYEIQFINGSHRQGESFFQILGRAGYRVGVVNVPFTYPPERVNGFMIAGFDAPSLDDTISWPPEVIREVMQEIGAYYHRGTFPLGTTPGTFKVTNIDPVIQNRTAVATYLMRKYPWDVFMTVFNETDHVQHFFWKEMEGKGPLGDRFKDVILHTYQKIDEAVGALLAHVGEDCTVLLMSDHGAGPLRKTVCLNRWLRDMGYLRYKSEHAEGGRERGLKELWYRLVRGLRRASKRYLPNSVKARLRPVVSDLVEKRDTYLLSNQVDWPQTRAYAFGIYGNIYLNIQGRDREGIVAPGDEMQVLVREITGKLMELKDPETREPVVERVYRREELYSGPHTTKAADLIVVFKDYAYFTEQSFRDSEASLFGDKLIQDCSDYPLTGIHRLEGLFMAAGPGIKSGFRIPEASLLDLAPTILHIMGLPVPEDMDGSVLRSIFGESSELERRPVRYEQPLEADDRDDRSLRPYSEEEAQEMYDHLKGLGYVS